MVTMEVLLKRSALNRAAPIRGEGTRQDRHVAKATLKWLVQNIRHLVFEVLCRNERIQQLATFVGHGVNFTATTAEICVIVECFPQIVD